MDPTIRGCQNTALITPVIETIFTRTTLEPVEFTFPEVTDTGSLALRDPTGLICGTKTYTLQTDGEILYPKPGGNDRQFLFGTNSESNVGLHYDTFVLVQNTNPHDGSVVSATVQIPIEIGTCATTGLTLLGAPLTAFVFINVVPSSTETDFPLYAPQPTDCPYNEDDFIYSLDGKNKPDWIYLDQTKKKIRFEPTESPLASQEYALELTVDYHGFQVKSSMSVLLRVALEDLIEFQQSGQ